MSTRSRLAVLLAGVVVIVLAFVFLRPDDEKKRTGAPATTPSATTDARAPATAQETTAAKPPAPAVKQVRIEIVDGNPVDGVTKVRVAKGETVALNVASDVSDEVHLHGYDISREVAPGKPARLKFKATIEGIFEVELENRGLEIASLRVDP